MNQLFIYFQYLVPQHWLSRLAGMLAESRWTPLKNTFIGWFVKRYNVIMAEAAEPDPLAYENFNAFFTRELKPDARPVIAGDENIACPADGAISQLGDVKEGRIFQAKGQNYSLLELLAGDQQASDAFLNGKFATVYLSPKDYHRVHMPVTGTLQSMTYVPGDLFSVNGTTAEHVPRLFARNERAVCLFETDMGPMAVVLVGAMIVAGIETVWAGQVAPIKRQISHHDYHTSPKPITLEKGAEMGRFKLGSTAIVLFGQDAVQWQAELKADSPVTMGELFATRAS